jgi:serine/threonine protein kinase
MVASRRERERPETPGAHAPGSPGTIKTLDFGLARMQADDDSTTLTREGAVMRTADYMSPEQCQQAHDVDICAGRPARGRRCIGERVQ